MVKKSVAKKMGRPPGSQREGFSRMAVVRATEIINQRKSPLDVMIKNMHFWDDAAENLQERLMEIVKRSMSDDETLTREELRGFQELFENIKQCRDKSQACAEGAAPYVHPRYQSVSLTNGDNDAVITMTLKPALPGEDRSYRDGPMIEYEREKEEV